MNAIPVMRLLLNNCKETAYRVSEKVIKFHKCFIQTFDRRSVHGISIRMLI